MRLRAIVRVGAVAGVILSVAAACDSTSSPPSDGAGGAFVDAAGRVDAGTGSTADANEPAPTTDAMVFDSGLPPSEAGLIDTKPPVFGEAVACDSFPLAVCDFNGTCPRIAAIIGSGVGAPVITPDAGPDGSAAMRLATDASQPGYGAGFGMPYYDFHAYPDASLDSVERCQVVCEARMRVAEVTPGTAIVVGGDFESGWSLDGDDGGLVHRTVGTSAPLSVPVSSDWFHVRIRLLPVDGGATSEVTITSSADASASTTLLVPGMGRSIRLGAFNVNGPADVYFDDVTCQVGDLPTP